MRLCRGALSGNRAQSWGGAMRNRESSPTLTNCILSGNLALENGGAIFNYTYSSAVLTNCTFYGNSANGNEGDAIYNYLSMNSSFGVIQHTIKIGAFSGLRLVMGIKLQKVVMFSMPYN